MYHVFKITRETHYLGPSILYLVLQGRLQRDQIDRSEKSKSNKDFTVDIFTVSPEASDHSASPKSKQSESKVSVNISLHKKLTLRFPVT